MRLLRNTIVVLAIVFALDVVATRYLLPDQVLALIDNERMARVYSPVYHHGLRPNRVVEKARWGGTTYRFATNSLGFKDRAPRRVPLVSNRRRMVIIGDSFTEGSGFGFDETFAGHIARALAMREIEVFNAGVVSYSPAIYYRKLKHLIESVGFGFDEAVVFLDISDIEDEADGLMLDAAENVVQRGDGALDRSQKRFGARARSFLKESSLAYRLASELNRARKRLLTHPDDCLAAVREDGRGVRTLGLDFLRRRLAKRRSRWTYDEAVFEAWGRRGLAAAAANMDRLARLLGKHGITLTLVVYPWPAQIFAAEREGRQTTFWRAWAAAKKVPFLDLFPAFIDGTEPLEIYARYHVACDNHWSAAGHAFVAERFLAFYRTGQH